MSEQPIEPTSRGDIVTVRITGAFFFGSAGVVAAALDRIAARPRAYVLDMSDVAALDSSAAAALRAFIGRASRAGALVYVAGAPRAVRRVLLANGLRSPAVRFAETAQAAADTVRARISAGDGVGAG